jgi:hypothetical protein
MNRYWTIRPTRSLGPIEFGMTPAQTAKFSDVYGKAELAPSGAATESTLDEMLAQFSEFFSAEDLEAAKAELAKQPPAIEMRLEIYPNKGLSLEYSRNSLSVIQIMAEADLTNLDNVEVLKGNSSEVLRLLELKNGAPGLFRSTQALFENAAVSLDNFSSLESGGKVRLIQNSDKRFADRNIELRAQAYLPEDEKAQFVSVSLL